MQVWSNKPTESDSEKLKSVSHVEARQDWGERNGRKEDAFFYTGFPSTGQFFLSSLALDDFLIRASILGDCRSRKRKWKNQLHQIIDPTRCDWFSLSASSSDSDTPPVLSISYCKRRSRKRNQKAVFLTSSKLRATPRQWKPAFCCAWISEVDKYLGSQYVSWKLPTFPSPKPTFYPK